MSDEGMCYEFFLLVLLPLLLVSNISDVPPLEGRVNLLFCCCWLLTVVLLSATESGLFGIIILLLKYGYSIQLSVFLEAGSKFLDHRISLPVV